MAKPKDVPSLRKHDQELVNWSAATPPPCEVHKCASFVKCGMLGLACQSFAQYVERGQCFPPTEPTAALFDKLDIPLAPHLAQKNRPKVRHLTDMRKCTDE